MKLRHHHGKCCSEPDVKDEGCVETEKGISWEYHCYHCDKTWTEIEPYEKPPKKSSKKSSK